MIATQRNGLQRGFALIELLVVIGVLAILAGLMLPAVQAARETARRAQCASHQKQLMLSAISYETTHGAFPPAWQSRLTTGPNSTRTLSVVALQVLLLQYLDQQSVYSSFNFDVKFTSLDDLAGP